MRLFSLLLLVFPAYIAYCQSSAVTINADETHSVVQSLEGALNSYILPAKAAEMRSFLKAHEGEYAELRDPKVLAERLTVDLRRIGGDKHLHVEYSPFAEAETSPESTELVREHEVEEAMALGIRGVDRLPGNIGYLNLGPYFSNDSESIDIVAAAMRLLHGSDALIIDLRRNGGGSTKMLDDLLAYFFASQQELTGTRTREDGKFTEEKSYTSLYTPSPRFLDRPIYVLTSSRTFSAAEECAYDLQTLKRATLVGETTAGGANPGFERSLGHHFEVFLPNAQAYNPITKTNWQGVGVSPDVPVKADAALETAYALALDTSKPHVSDPDLEKVRATAISDPKAALKKAGFLVTP